MVRLGSGRVSKALPLHRVCTCARSASRCRVTSTPRIGDTPTGRVNAPSYVPRDGSIEPRGWGADKRGGKDASRRIATIAGAALAVMIIASSATAVSRNAATSSGATAAAAPFAQSWANVPRTPAARKAKSVLVFGQEQDIVGFNAALSCCSQFWAAVQGVPVIRGTYNVTNTLKHVLDLVSEREGDEDDTVVHDSQGRVLELGRPQDPCHVQGLRLHLAGVRRSEERRGGP